MESVSVLPPGLRKTERKMIVVEKNEISEAGERSGVNFITAPSRQWHAKNSKPRTIDLFRGSQ